MLASCRIPPSSGGRPRVESVILTPSTAALSLSNSVPQMTNRRLSAQSYWLSPLSIGLLLARTAPSNRLPPALTDGRDWPVPNLFPDSECL
jgi:hypothetical protein